LKRAGTRLEPGYASTAPSSLTVITMSISAVSVFPTNTPSKNIKGGHRDADPLIARALRFALRLDRMNHLGPYIEGLRVTRKPDNRLTISTASFEKQFTGSPVGRQTLDDLARCKNRHANRKSKRRGQETLHAALQFVVLSIHPQLLESGQPVSKS